MFIGKLLKLLSFFIRLSFPSTGYIRTAISKDLCEDTQFQDIPSHIDKVGVLDFITLSQGSSYSAFSFVYTFLRQNQEAPLLGVFSHNLVFQPEQDKSTKHYILHLVMYNRFVTTSFHCYEFCNPHIFLSRGYDSPYIPVLFQEKLTALKEIKMKNKNKNKNKNKTKTVIFLLIQGFIPRF